MTIETGNLDINTALIMTGFLLVFYFHSKIIDSDDLGQRLQRFYATMISKKVFAWWVITGFFCWDQYVVKEYQFAIWEYMTFTAAMFGIDVMQKHIGLRGKRIEEEKG